MQLEATEPIGMPKLNMNRGQKGEQPAGKGRMPHFSLGAADGAGGVASKAEGWMSKLAPAVEEAAVVA